MDTIDDIGHRAAATMRAEADALADVDAMLESVAAATAASSGRGRRVRATSTDVRPRRWAVVGAVAAVIAAVVAGIAVVSARDPNARVVPAPSVPPRPVPTSPVDTTAPPSTASSTSAPPSVPASSVAPSAGDGLAVSYKNPPPFLEPQPFGAVEAVDDGSLESVAVMESGVVLVEDGTASVVAWDGSTRRIDVSAASNNPDGNISGWAAGPGDVLYALTVSQTTEASIVAVPLSGGRQGAAVAATEIPLVVIPERPAGSIGHGPDGLVDRVGRIDGVVAPYVDDQGRPWPDRLGIPVYGREGDVISNLDGSQRWPLQIERARGAENGLDGPAGPSPAPGGGAVWWDWIGPRSSNGDVTRGSMPVMVFMAPDGTAAWRRIPAGWEPVAADVWGTVLARRDGTTLELALATPTIATTPAPTPAEQAVTDYLTALASRDYDAAAVPLGNDGLSPAVRPDLAAVRDGLGPSGDDLAGALREWCEGSSPAACWMPTSIIEQEPSGIEPDGSVIVAASYDDVVARFVVGSWEGQPSIFGVPPLADIRGLERARRLLGVGALYAPSPADGGLVLASTTGTKTVRPPSTGAGAIAVTPDGDAISWTTGDPIHTTVTDTNGTVLCEFDEQVLEVVGQPGAYRAIVTRDGAVGPPDALEAEPAFEVDCATGVETPTDPWTWNGGPVYARKYVVGGRTLILTGTDHHAELTGDAGTVISGGDNVFTVPAFSGDGSIVVYGAHTGSANPWLATHVIARATATGALLWDAELDVPVNAVSVGNDRVVVETGVAGSNDQLGPAGLTAIDLATGEVMVGIPAVFNVLHVE